jgi:hypothetical protein
MIFLYILLGLIALIAFLLLLPLKVRVLLDENGKLAVRVWISFVALLTHPAKERSFRPEDYSPRAIAKRERRQAKQYERQQKKKAKRKQKASAHVEKKAPATLSQKINKLTDTISFVTSLLRKLQEKFLRSVHIHLHEFSIRVGSDDAAKTALLFGVISPAAAALLTALSEFTNLHLHHPEKICVAPTSGFERTLQTGIPSIPFGSGLRSVYLRS